MSDFTYEKDDTTEVVVEVIEVKERAIRVRVIDNDKKAWIPKSLISDESEIAEEEGSIGRMYVAEWKAKEEGLLDDE